MIVGLVPAETAGSVIFFALKGRDHFSRCSKAGAIGYGLPATGRINFFAKMTVEQNIMAILEKPLPLSKHERRQRCDHFAALSFGIEKKSPRILRPDLERRGKTQAQPNRTQVPPSARARL